MTGPRSPAEQELKEGHVMQMLFGPGFDALDTDKFDGSKEEQHIFMEVFNLSAKNTSKHNVVSNTMNFQKDGNDRSKWLASSSCENSVLTSYTSTKNSFGEASQVTCIDATEDSGSRCCLDNSSSGSVSDPCDAQTKRALLSSIERKNCRTFAQSSSLSVPGDELNDVDQSQTTSSKLMPHQQQSPCLLVETCGQGVLSTYYVSKTQEETIGSDDIPLVIKCKSQMVRDSNLVSEPTFVTSPVSQESFASGLVVRNATSIPAETTGEPIYVKHSVEESSILKSATIDVASRRQLIRELPERLSSHAHCLLTDAGWKIKPRVRSDRAKLASYYIAPEEKPVVTSLSQAWKVCGRRLYTKALDTDKVDNGREWTNIDRFWSDLIDTLLYIENNIQRLGVSFSLLKRWQLLDPFIAVVCISRKIGVLREGKSLKAVNSATFILNDENNGVSMVENNDIVSHLAKVNSGSGSYDVQPAVHLDHAGVNDAPLNQESWQYCHDMQNSSQRKRQKQKHSCSAENQRKGPISLAVCIENNLQDTKCWHHSRDKESASPNNAAQGSGFTCIYGAEGSCSTNSKDFAIGEFSGQDILPSVIPVLDNPEASKAHSLTKSLCLEGNSVPSIAHDELLVGGGPSKCKSNKKILMEVKQQTTVISAKRRVYGKHLSTFDFCDDLDLPSQGNTADVREIIDEKLGTQPSATNSSFNCRLPAFNIQHNLTAEKATIRDPKSEDLSFSSNHAGGSGKKIHKKSKKISEIRACKVDDTCDLEYKEALGAQFDEKIDDHLKIPCNQQDSHTPVCYSNLGCINESTCAAGESHSTIKLRKNMVISGTRTLEYMKGKKGYLPMPLEDEAAHMSMHANIHEGGIQCSKWDANGLNSQLLSQSESPSLLAKEHHKCTEDSVVASDDSQIGKEVIRSVGLALDQEGNQMIVKPKEAKALKKNKWKRPRGFRINDDDLLIAAIIKNKDYVSCNDEKGPKLGVSQPKKLKKLESQKGGCKLLLRTPGKSGLSKDGKGIVLGARTVLCWLIERGVLSLKDVLQYRNSKKKDLVKDGWITRNGILCKCCNETFSVSAFKAHSGCKIQKPSSNLFLLSGRSYTLCQLQAWSAEYKARKNRMSDMGVEEVDHNDDTCGLCVDGGELICCDNCPSTYHQVCLGMQDLPEGSWYCHNCICKSCGDVVKATQEDSRSLVVLECSQCEHKYHDACIKKRSMSNGQVASGTWFCGRNCKEVYFGLRSHVGILNHLADGFSWTILRCNHDDQKINSTQKIALMAECNTKLAIALSIMEECFLPMVDPRTGIDMIPHVLYNWGSNFTRLNYRGFYTVVLEKSDEVLAVAPIRVHGVAVAEMPLIATASEHRRQGMCRRLMDAIEKMLKSFHVKMLVLSAVPGLVETWTLHFGFRPIGELERRQLNDINLMLFPGTEMLIKNLEESTTEESGLNHLFSRVTQSLNPDEVNVTDTNTGQTDETARTDSRDGGALSSALNSTDQVEEHDQEQKDVSVSLSDTPISTSKPDESNFSISESFCKEAGKLEISRRGKFHRAAHSAQETFNSTALPCYESSATDIKDNKSPANHAPAEPIVNNAESENVNIVAETKATQVVEEGNRLLSAGHVIEENSVTVHSSELK